MPSQPVRLLGDEERVREILYKEELSCRQIQENAWVDRDQLQEGS